MTVTHPLTHSLIHSFTHSLPHSLTHHTRVFHYAGETVKGDRELVILAGAKGHSAILIPGDLRDDKEVILAFLEAGETWSDTLQAIRHNDLINDKDIFMAFLKLGLQQEDLERHYRHDLERNTAYTVNNPWVRYEQDSDVQSVILDCKNTCMSQTDSSEI